MVRAFLSKIPTWLVVTMTAVVVLSGTATTVMIALRLSDRVERFERGRTVIIFDGARSQESKSALPIPTALK